MIVSECGLEYVVPSLYGLYRIDEYATLHYVIFMIPISESL